MASGSAPAKRGFKSENDFIEKINNDSSFNNSLRSYLKTKSILTAVKAPSGLKSDIYLNYDSNIDGASIKSAEVNFGQLDRRWLAEFVSKLNMSTHLENILNQCLTNKVINKNDKFILDIYQKDVKDYFVNNLLQIVTEMFKRSEHNLKYLVVCDIINSSWHIGELDAVIQTISNSPVSFSSKGVIKIGNYLTVQRKGGNGAHIKIPKTNPLHPGNQIQFKLKPISLLTDPNLTFYKI